VVVAIIIIIVFKIIVEIIIAMTWLINSIIIIEGLTVTISAFQDSSKKN